MHIILFFYHVRALKKTVILRKSTYRNERLYKDMKGPIETPNPKLELHSTAQLKCFAELGLQCYWPNLLDCVLILVTLYVLTKEASCRERPKTMKTPKKREGGVA